MLGERAIKMDTMDLRAMTELLLAGGGFLQRSADLGHGLARQDSAAELRPPNVGGEGAAAASMGHPNVFDFA